MINLLIVFLWVLCTIGISVSFIVGSIDKDELLLVCFIAATLSAYKAHQEMWK